MYRQICYARYISSRSVTEEFMSQQFIAPPRPQKEILQFLPKKKDAAILDLGCGFGSFLSYLQKDGYTNLHGVEIGREQSDFLLGKKLQITQADIFFYLKNTHLKFSFILLYDVMEHFKKNEIVELIPLLKKHLIPNGILAIRVPNGDPLFSRGIMYGDFTHETFFTKRSLLQLLSLFDFNCAGIFPSLAPSMNPIIKAIRVVLFKIISALYRPLLLLDAPSDYQHFFPAECMLGIFSNRLSPSREAHIGPSAQQAL